jgi:hypothetical protein
VTLKQRHRLSELAGPRETGHLAHIDFRERVHDVIFRTPRRDRRDACAAAAGVVGDIQLVRSASAAFTAGLAWKAPRTCTEAMAARASSGVTSLAMLARPRT